jgi:hypothetical protein
VKALVLLSVLLFLAAPLVPAQETYGTIRATTRLRPDGTKCTTIVNPDTHTADETIYDARNKVLKKTTYLLGDGDIAVGAIFYDAKGAVIYKASYQRDGAGRVTETAFTGPDGRYYGKRVFVYGVSGDNATQIIDYDANGQLIAQAQPTPSKSSKKKH